MSDGNRRGVLSIVSALIGLIGFVGAAYIKHMVPWMRQAARANFTSAVKQGG